MRNNSILFFNKSNKMIKKILLINIVIFLISNILAAYSISQGIDYAESLKHLGLSSDILVAIKRPWTFITNMFTHVDILHILFNMLYFWFFSRFVQEKYGEQSILSLYILGGLLGAFFYIFFYSFLAEINPQSLAIGASGSVTSIMVASAVISPNRKINLLFIGLTKLKWIVIVLFTLTTIINFHENTGGKIVHLGGACFGFLYAYFIRAGLNIGSWFDSLIRYFSSIFTNVKNKNTKTSYTFRGSIDKRDNLSKELSRKNVISKKQTEIEMNKLLDKIKDIGYDNLSNEEKKMLEELSKKY